MDAPEDELDIKLQKMSGDLIADFDKSLGPFLRRKDGVVRSRVRSRETERLVSGLLNPFQELPQLLDPHLQKWLTPLVDAFLEYLLKRDTKARHRFPQRQQAAGQSTGGDGGAGSKEAAAVPENGATADLLMPLPAAISKIIYTLCKIRGEKVVVRFLNNETKYLEVLLSALEQAERVEERWTWEQRYVVLLWLSHLMLVPFDLASISSLSSPGPSSTLEEEEDVGHRDATKRRTNISGFTWPATQVPGITRRIIPLAIKYISSPGKERDAAKAVLVRISMRRDMQALGVLDALVAWAVGALGAQAQTPYYYIGVLGFLSGILTSSADTSDMDVYLDRIFKAVHDAAEKSSDGGPLSSALSRKSVIKVIRAIAVLLLRNPERASQDDTSTEIIETTISFLLEQLGDNDTPVRFAASKALSIITLRLEPDMATQVVEAVIESLSKNVLWHKDPSNPAAPRKRDLSAVDPLEWHGLMLTLAHLLYRRSPPAENLPDIIHALIMGLSFERRSPSGGSIGTNVRDAACFGIWALARRYSTKELLAVPTPERLYKKDSRSIIQILATELILAGCLDAAGNIRRGSSAALQELIGRHPDTVEEGIKVVQVVDYHGVALRGRAVQDIALSVTKLAGLYGEAVLEALLSWRGVGDADAASRRAAGRAFGGISAELARAAEGGSIARLTRAVELVLESIRGLAMRQVEERHGLLLSFAAVLDSVPEMMVVGVESGGAGEGFVKVVMDALVWILDDCQSKTYRKPELIAEAASTLVVAAFPILQAATIGFDDGDKQLLPGAVLVKDDKDAISKRVKAIKTIPEQVQQVASLTKTNLTDWLTRTEEEVLPAASDAALVMLVFSGQQQRESTLKEWVEKVRHRPSSGVRIKNTTGYFFAVTKPYQVVATLDSEARDEAQGLVSKALNERWQNDGDVDTHVAILKGLTGTGTLRNGVDMFMDLVIGGLDDYTTNARGDVGSLARLQAIRATKWVWEEFRNNTDGWKKVVGRRLFLRILRLAAEKLDRVRVEAQAALAVVLKPAQGAKLRKDTFSSVGYFSFLLDLLPHGEEWLDQHVAAEVTADRGLWMEELLSGLVSSADTGNEDLVIATRQALTEFCERSAENSLAVCSALVRNLKSRQGQDRVLVPTLEVVAFLFHVGVFAKCPAGSIDYKGLCLQVQKACYKTGNVRKTEACIRVYGGIIAASGGLLDKGKSSGGDDEQEKGIKEAKKRLGALMMHPWPRVKSLVVDEIWGWSVMERCAAVVVVDSPDGDEFVVDTPAPGKEVNGGDMVGQQIMGIDWAKSEKGQIKLMVKSIGFE